MTIKPKMDKYDECWNRIMRWEYSVLENLSYPRLSRCQRFINWIKNVGRG